MSSVAITITPNEVYAATVTKSTAKLENTNQNVTREQATKEGKVYLVQFLQKQTNILSFKTINIFPNCDLTNTEI